MSVSEHAVQGRQGRAAVRAGAEPARRRIRSAYVPWLLLAPWLVGLVGITLGPMVASLYLSFTDYSLLSSPKWVGLTNYVQLLTSDPQFLAAAKVTLIYVVVGVPLQLAFALGIAVLLNRGLAAMNFYRSVYYLPSLLGSSVAVALLWRQIFGADGLVNVVLRLVGWAHPPNWIASPEYALGTIIVLHVWTFGSPMIIFLAGLRQVPQEMYEAADVDGAGSWAKFIRITVPMVSPVIFFNLILQMINAFQAFTQAYVVSGGDGGPVNSTLFYTLALYQEAFTNFNMGYASAMAWVLFLVIALFTWVAFGTSGRWVHYEGGRR